jgi:hypothetical protein
LDERNRREKHHPPSPVGANDIAHPTRHPSVPRGR